MTHLRHSVAIFGSFRPLPKCPRCPVRWTSWRDHEAARIHRGRQRGRHFSIRSARPAGASDSWLSAPCVGGTICTFCSGVSRGPRRGWLRRGPERGDRIPLGRGARRPASNFGDRISPTRRQRNRHARQHQRLACSQGSNRNNTYCVWRCGRSGQVRTRRKSRPAWWQCDRHQLLDGRTGIETVRPASSPFWSIRPTC